MEEAGGNVLKDTKIDSSFDMFCIELNGKEHVSGDDEETVVVGGSERPWMVVPINKLHGMPAMQPPCPPANQPGHPAGKSMRLLSLLSPQIS